MKQVAFFILSASIIFFSLHAKSETFSSNNFHIDIQNGDDSNNGLSSQSAWKTFLHVNEKVFKPGDSILLRRGCEWIGSLSPKGSGEESKPIIIGAYGEGNRPHINGNGQVRACVYLRNQSYWVIENLEISNYAPERGWEIRNGILVENDGGGVLKNFIIRDNYVHHVSGTFRYINSVDPHEYGGISVNVSYNSKPTDRFENVLIEKNTVEESGRTGIVVWDHKWTGDNEATTGVRIRHNKVTEIDSDGILTFGCNGAIIEYNVANGCGRYVEEGGFNGTVAIWCTRGRNCIIQYNEAFNTYKRGDNADGQGFDIDIDSYDCIVQYNYSHDNEGGFMLFIDASNSTGSIVRYNISQNDKMRIFVFAGSTTPNTKIYNNTIYIKEGLNTNIFDHSWDDPGDVNAPWIFKNNIIINYGTGTYRFAGNGGIFSNNIYFGQHPAGEPEEPNKITKNPLLENPGNGQIGFESLSGYKPTKKSPAIKSGAVIDHNGGKDFFGNPVTVHDRPTIGAIN